MKISYIVLKKIDSAQKLIQFKPGFYFLNSNLCSRQDAFLFFEDQWICFFDSDCIYTDDLIKAIEAYVLKLYQTTVLAGFYKNPTRPSLLQVAHNFIANQWLLESVERAEKYVLGGFFVLYSSSVLQQINFSNLPKWGGEDKALALLLQKNGFCIQADTALQVEHQTSEKLSHFLKRAWYHGFNFVETEASAQKVNLFLQFKTWSQRMKGLNQSVQLFVWLHFSILVLAKTIREVLRKSTKTKSKTDKLTIF